jgi:hypothetical protein
VTPLLLGLGSLLAAPALDRLVPARGGAESWLEGFVLAVVLGTVAVLLLPEAIGVAGPVALLALGVGLVAGVGVHRLLEHRSGDWMWVAALLAHSLLDGGTLASDPHAHALASAVILHNAPVGLAVWRIASHEGGPRIAGGVLVAMAAATALGFVLLEPVAGALGEAPLYALQAGFAGVLLHPLAHLGRSRGPWGALGVATGVAALALLSHGHAGQIEVAGGHVGAGAAFLVLAGWTGLAFAAGSVLRLPAWAAPAAMIAALFDPWIGALVFAAGLAAGRAPEPALPQLLAGLGVAAAMEPALAGVPVPAPAAWGALGVAAFARVGVGVLPVLAVYQHHTGGVPVALLALAPALADPSGRGLAVGAALGALAAATPVGSLNDLDARAQAGLLPHQAAGVAALGVLALRALAVHGPAALLDAVLHPEEATAEGTR